jgi:hypothetical protein
MAEINHVRELGGDDCAQRFELTDQLTTGEIEKSGEETGNQYRHDRQSKPPAQSRKRRAEQTDAAVEQGCEDDAPDDQQQGLSQEPDQHDRNRQTEPHGGLLKFAIRDRIGEIRWARFLVLRPGHLNAPAADAG